MSFVTRAGSFKSRIVAPTPGDTFHFYSRRAKKLKYHLCVSWDYQFVFLNTPYDEPFRHDFRVDSHVLHFLKPTRQRFSAISCATLIDLENQDGFERGKPQHKGNLQARVLMQLLDHLRCCDHVERAEARRIAETIAAFRFLVHT